MPVSICRAFLQMADADKIVAATDRIMFRDGHEQLNREIMIKLTNSMSKLKKIGFGVSLNKKIPPNFSGRRLRSQRRLDYIKGNFLIAAQFCDS